MKSNLTVKEAILKIRKKWLTYDEIIILVNNILWYSCSKHVSTQAIGRNVRLLVADGKLEVSKVKGKIHNKYRRL